MARIAALRAYPCRAHDPSNHRFCNQEQNGEDAQGEAELVDPTQTL